MKFLNLTQFSATKEQAKLGVVDLADNSKLKELLKLDIDTNLEERADEIWKLAVSEGGLMPGDSVLIAGAPSLMAPLEKRMREGFIIPYYSFSERVSSERVDENGNTIKVSEFKHKKFIEGELDRDSPVFTLPRYKSDNHSELKIVNLTQHNATEEQMRDGVFEPKDKDAIKKLITFNGNEDLKAVAKEVARIARENGANAAMIGGAPYFMAPLEEALAKEGIIPLYAFSEQKQKTIALEDGTIRKVNEFKYLGLVEAGNKMTITKEIARGERYREAIRVIEEKAKKWDIKKLLSFPQHTVETSGIFFIMKSLRSMIIMKTEVYTIIMPMLMELRTTLKQIILFQ